MYNFFIISLYTLLNWQVLAATDILDLDNQLYKLIRADDELNPTTAEPGSQTEPPPLPTNGTTHAECEDNGNCCFMYTYPGNEHRSTGDDNAPRVCNDLPGIKRDKTHNVACFDPLFYSDSEEGIRPDPDKVEAFCIEHGLPCFCSTNQQCLKMTFVQNNAILNETRFCGTMTNVGSDKVVTSGCFQEQMEGSAMTREVCACETIAGSYCNAAASSGISGFILVTIFIGYYLL